MMLVDIDIDGKRYKTENNRNLLDLLLSEGFDVPHLCYEKDLSPVGSCGLCLVEIKGKGIVKACEEKTKHGMEVITWNKRIEKARKDAFIFLLQFTRHPTSCLFCNKYDECKGIDKCLKGLDLKKGCKACPKDGDCVIQKLAKKFHLSGLEIEAKERGLEEIKEPFFVRDYNYCILCSKCIRICYEKRLQGSCIAYLKIGTHIPSFLEEGCKSCGSCLDICPTGTFYNPKEEEPDYWVKGLCPYCGTGCALELGVKDERIVKIRGDKQGINNGELCVKGRFGIVEFVNSKERLESPLLKKNGSFIPISWEDAIGIICKNLKGHMGKIGVIGSAKCTNEENFLIQKFARLVLKTNNIDHCARLCHSSTATALSMSLGYSAMTNSIEEIQESKTIIIIGANPTENHPIIGLKIKEAKEKGARLIIINPMKIELCDIADIWLRPYPGTDTALLNAMARFIIENGLEDRDFIEKNTTGFEEYREYIRSLDTKELFKICRANPEDIINAARLYATHRPSSIYFAMGITQHLNGTQNVLAISNLGLITGNLGIPGSGINPLRGQNNVQGACDMGVLPDLLPGYQPIGSQNTMQAFERAWNGKLPLNKGLTLVEMIQGAISEKIESMYIIGENPAITDPDMEKTIEALKRLKFLVVQDIFMSDTARIADVILPAASFAEKDGTFTNTERRVQRINKAIGSPGNAKPDLDILCMLGRAMGYEKQFSYKNAEQVFKEIRALVPEYRGITYEKLKENGIQWPCPHEGHPGTGSLYLDGFGKRRARFFKVDSEPKDKLPDNKFPFSLIIGRNLYHYHSGTMSMRISGIKEICPEPFIEICIQDAKEMGLSNGDVVEICSGRGSIKGKVKLSERLRPGILFTTFHFPEMPVNLLTSPETDPLSKIPSLKSIPVNILKGYSETHSPHILT